jgi:hypothetical protein
LLMYFSKKVIDFLLRMDFWAINIVLSKNSLFNR